MTAILMYISFPVEGGIPKRLTWHPCVRYCRGFSPDGKSVLFISQRALFTTPYFQLFTVPVTGGPATQLEIPNAYYADYSPDGKLMAYDPTPDQFRQWKHYRGGGISHIWQFSFADKSIVKLPQPDGGCNDVQPMWMIMLFISGATEMESSICMLMMCHQNKLNSSQSLRISLC